MRGLAPTSKTANAKLVRVLALASCAIIVSVWPAHAEGWQHMGSAKALHSEVATIFKRTCGTGCSINRSRSVDGIDVHGRAVSV